MIEDKKMGLKVAENKEEAILETTIKRIRQDTDSMELSLELNKVLLEYLDERINKLNK